MAEVAATVQTSRMPPSEPGFRVALADGGELYVHRWQPAASPRASVLVAHGMAEHGGRYERLARALTDAGYAVYAPDQRGHGRSAQVPGDLGYFADGHGWRCLVDDLYLVRRRIAEDLAAAWGAGAQDMPVFLLGHSMGALVAQHYLFGHGDTVAGVVLSGPGGVDPVRARLGLALATAERVRLGPRSHSPLLQLFILKPFNLPFVPLRTDSDWLSSDAAEVDKYVADPLCGFALSTQAWHDMFAAMLQADRLENLRRMPEAVPVMVMAGGRDAVGSFGRGPRRIVDRFRRAGMRAVELRLYHRARHEIFNEVVREQVQRELIAWLEGVLAHSA